MPSTWDDAAGEECVLDWLLCSKTREREREIT